MKVISVPTSPEAMARLDLDECVLGDLEEVVLSQADFELLWKSGFFKELNQSLNLMIDEYEDEVITSNMINDAIECLNSFIKRHGVVSEKINEIGRLFNLAGEKETGIFFFF